ncbi:MAG: aldehyde dehydrogenase family protein, partial [Allosphingosinicella sp.]
MQSTGEGSGEYKAQATATISQALTAFPAWDARPVDERADCLDRLADLLERERDSLMRICVQEARKTIPD